MRAVSKNYSSLLSRKKEERKVLKTKQMDNRSYCVSVIDTVRSFTAVVSLAGILFFKHFKQRNPCHNSRKEEKKRMDCARFRFGLYAI